MRSQEVKQACWQKTLPQLEDKTSSFKMARGDSILIKAECKIVMWTLLLFIKDLIKMIAGHFRCPSEIQEPLNCLHNPGNIKEDLLGTNRASDLSRDDSWIYFFLILNPSHLTSRKRENAYSDKKEMNPCYPQLARQ